MNCFRVQVFDDEAADQVVDRLMYWVTVLSIVAVHVAVGGVVI
jgi:hypothetical protein